MSANNNNAVDETVLFTLEPVAFCFRRNVVGNERSPEHCASVHTRAYVSAVPGLAAAVRPHDYGC